MTLLLLLLLLPPLLPASMLKQLDDSMANMQVNNRPLKVGHTLTITGIPKTGDGRFEVNILSGSDIAFYMSVRLTLGSVVCNSRMSGVWGAEVFQGGFPFKHNELFKFTVTLTHEEFLVILSDGSEVHFPNRLGASEYLDFSFKGGVLIRSFEIN
ncbi:beta-galactoside-binding lectin [Gadus morhua]|uniref:beta-galactoside-binding lectin n=1 Tax=Gadus morhua TaxID=8049 RepID=UPI0011B366AC|nr:beta-galactoside-binding lectin-like [Gadus morhua]